MEELSILGEFVVPMGENEGIGLDAYVPGDGPLAMVLDLPDRLRLSKKDFMVANTSSVFSHRDHMVEGTEDDVEVNGFTSQDVFPFRRWEAEGCLA